MTTQRTDDFTYAGAFDHAYDEYSDVIRHTPLARSVNEPLLYQNAPEASGDMSPDLQADGPYYGTVGAFHAAVSVVQPTGPWYPDYGGNVPSDLQPKLRDIEPWLLLDGTE